MKVIVLYTGKLAKLENFYDNIGYIKELHSKKVDFEVVFSTWQDDLTSENIKVIEQNLSFCRYNFIKSERNELFDTSRNIFAYNNFISSLLQSTNIGFNEQQIVNRHLSQFFLLQKFIETFDYNFDIVLKTRTDAINKSQSWQYIEETINTNFYDGGQGNKFILDNLSGDIYKDIPKVMCQVICNLQEYGCVNDNFLIMNNQKLKQFKYKPLIEWVMHESLNILKNSQLKLSGENIWYRLLHNSTLLFPNDTIGVPKYW